MKHRRGKKIFLGTFQFPLVMAVYLSFLHHDGIGEFTSFNGIVHIVYMISHQSTGLSFPSDVSNPSQFVRGILWIFLRIGKGSENGPQHMITNGFRIIDLV